MRLPDDHFLRVNSFRVHIGDREIGVAEVSRLSSVTVADEPSRHSVHGHEPVVLRRALTVSRELYEWRRRIVDGREDRQDITITQLSGPGGEAVNAWRLVRAWPSRWSGPAFDAMDSGIAFEELELTFDDLVWLDR